MKIFKVCYFMYCSVLAVVRKEQKIGKMLNIDIAMRDK